MNATLSATLAALVRPALVCLVIGGLKALEDYQSTPHWAAALVDGGITAGLAASAMLGVNGAAGGVRSAAARAVAKRPSD